MSAPDDVLRRPRSPETRSAGGFRAWTARHPLTAFVVLVFPLGWAILAVPALAFHGVIPGGRALPVEIFALALTVLVMLPAAAWVVSATEGRRGVRALFARTFRWRFPIGWWAAVLFAVPVMSIAVGAALGRSVTTADLAAVLLDGFLVGFLLPLVLVNLWEETVWAGFVQTRLEERHGLLVGALLTSIGFAGIHLPMVFAAELSASSLAESLGFLVVAAVVFRLTAGVVMRGAAGSVLAVAVLHASWNASSGEEGIVDDLLSGGQPVLIAVIALVLVTAAALAVVRPRLDASGTR
jgi:membrane protease YdiL (CAAX protease family)